MVVSGSGDTRQLFKQPHPFEAAIHVQGTLVRAGLNTLWQDAAHSCCAAPATSPHTSRLVNARLVGRKPDRRAPPLTLRLREDAGSTSPRLRPRATACTTNDYTPPSKIAQTEVNQTSVEVPPVIPHSSTVSYVPYVLSFLRFLLVLLRLQSLYLATG